MRKKTPCEFCENDRWYNVEDGEGWGGHQLSIEVYPGRAISITSYAVEPVCGETEMKEEIIPLNYCPVCGRKLEAI